MRTRADILDVAAVALGSTGYGDLSLEELGRLAGVSRGTVYAHFPEGRDQIVREAYKRVSDDVFTLGARLHEQVSSFEDRVGALVTALVETTATPEGRFYGVISPDLAPVLSGMIGSTSEPFNALIVEDLARERAADRLISQVPLTALAAVLNGAIRAAGAAAAAHSAADTDLIEAVRVLALGLLAPTDH